MSVAVVVPTLARPSLHRLLDSLAASAGPRPDEIVVVDDRPAPAEPVAVPDGVRVLRSGGRGPAAARNAGWRATSSAWIAFLDDDVEVTRDWLTDLATDLDAAGTDVGGVQGQISVPLPRGRRPTDWERGTAGLATAQWITADLAYRRSVLVAVEGFDERFPRAFREDADLALRVQSAGHRLVVGRRRTVHPVRPAGWWASLNQQRGNADDALMRRRHGPSWHKAAGAAVGRRSAHAAVTVAAALAVGGAVSGHRRVAVLGAAGWAAGTARFAWIRIAPGPRTPDEIARMLTTSVAIPPAAVWYWLRGTVIHRHIRRADATRLPAVTPLPTVDAVLVDRDGTLIHDVPYNGDPDRVQAMPGVREALDRLRAAGLPVAVVTNQSGVARGLITEHQVAAVNARVEEMLGPFAGWQVCPHAEGDGCRCRKPKPGMVLDAAAALDVPVERCVLIGDIGADVQAAHAAGAVGLLVPTDATRALEIAAAAGVFPDLGAAVEAVLGRRAAATSVPV